jgi:hypothetical protein
MGSLFGSDINILLWFLESISWMLAKIHQFELTGRMSLTAENVEFELETQIGKVFDMRSCRREDVLTLRPLLVISGCVVES